MAADAPEGQRHRLGRVLDAVTRTGRRTWWTTFGLTSYVYLMSAHWPAFHSMSTDTVAPSWAAWHFVRTGSFWLEDAPGLPDILGFGESGGHVVAQRTPGVILIGVPIQALFRWSAVSPETPGVMTAVVVTAVAVANTALVLHRLGQARVALAAALVLALGTGLWTTAAVELWTHGPDVFWLSLVLLALSSDRLLLAGACFAPGIMTRPHLALVAFCIGVGLAAARRSVRPLLSIGIPAAVGVGGFLLWTDIYFGTANVGGGYTYASDNLTTAQPSQLEFFIENLAGYAVSPTRGLLVYSPVVLIAMLCLPAGWRRSPAWVRAAFVGGVVYLLAQARISAFVGGYGFFSYRYPVETLVLVTPLVFVGYLEWAQTTARRRWAAVLAWLSVMVHVVGATTASVKEHLAAVPDPWRSWILVDAIRAAPVRGVVACVVAVVGVLAIVRSEPRRLAQGPPAPQRQ